MLKKIAVGVGILVGLAVLGIAALFIWGSIDPQHLTRTLNGPDEAAPLIGKRAPAFALKRIGADDTVKLSDYRGKVVILDFWATWCGPCERTSPNIEAVRARNDDVVVLAINVREGENTNAKDLEKHVDDYFVDKGYGFVNVQGDDALLQRYKSWTIPHVFVIDEEGIVRYSGVGAHNEANMEEALAAAR